jgi:ribosome assembly protein RRB1
MYHAMRPEWPCLSFDVLPDELGGGRSRFPHTIYAVCGTQADRAEHNKLTVMKMSELHKMRRPDDDDESMDDSDSDDDDDDAPDEDPTLAHASVAHPGGVNRVRAMPQRSSIVATWSDSGHVRVWDLSGHLAMLDPPRRLGAAPPPARQDDPICTFGGHRDEGFAMDWSGVAPGRLVTGDCAGAVHVWEPRPGGGAGDGSVTAATSGDALWDVSATPLTGHTGSVEDLQWSPTEPTVFVSASADRTLRVWDTRQRSGAMLSIRAHDDDVNVVSWNRHVTYLLVSGADDGSFKVWDLRTFGSADGTPPDPVGHFRHHKAPITSIMWHPTDESVLAASSADDQLTIWDLSVEEDADAVAGLAESAGAGTVGDLPPQLLFVHQGQHDIKELHFHPQIPGVLMSTAADGINVFKPAI